MTVRACILFLNVILSILSTVEDFPQFIGRFDMRVFQRIAKGSWALLKLKENWKASRKFCGGEYKSLW